jgi:aldose 1-epimerase
VSGQVTDNPAPSGEQVELVFERQRAVVVSVGAGIREYTFGETPVLDGFGRDDVCDGGRGQLLLPWPNRLRGGSYTWHGRDLQLPLSEPDRRNAIHGLTRWLPWTVVAREPSSARLRLDLPPQPGYPFQLRLEAKYALSAHGLAVTVSALNLGREPAPFGAGAHPYIGLGAAHADDLVLRVPAARRLTTDERGTPIGSADVVAGTAEDFRAGRRIGSAVLDLAYAELTRDDAGVARVDVAAASGQRATVWMDGHHRYVMVFTGDTLEPSRRRRSVAIEPMTCAPNALQSGDGLVSIEPGERLEVRWGVAPGAGATPI